MISQRGKKPIGLRTAVVVPFVIADVAVIELADIVINSFRLAIGIIVVPGGDNEIHFPAIDHFRHAERTGTLSLTIITDHCEEQHVYWRWRNLWGVSRLGSSGFDRQDRRQRAYWGCWR